ncbi:MAG: YraN family protein [Lachnospiraceae bacterium]|nr:YraN family protein [Lachnospiraceae bacterium]
MENLRTKGGSYEQRAAEYLQSRGYEILQMNYRCRIGEVDIVARDGSYLVFLEVKYRRTTNRGLPVEAVGYAKQKKISAVASYYLMSHGCLDNVSVRFDVVAILGEDIQLFQNAFSYVGYGR